jgi:hypothetical protein
MHKFKFGVFTFGTCPLCWPCIPFDQKFYDISSVTVDNADRFVKTV